MGSKLGQNGGDELNCSAEIAFPHFALSFINWATGTHINCSNIWWTCSSRTETVCTTKLQVIRIPQNILRNRYQFYLLALFANKKFTYEETFSSFSPPYTTDMNWHHVTWVPVTVAWRVLRLWMEETGCMNGTAVSNKQLWAGASL